MITWRSLTIVTRQGRQDGGRNSCCSPACCIDTFTSAEVGGFLGRIQGVCRAVAAGARQRQSRLPQLSPRHHR